MAVAKKKSKSRRSAHVGLQREVERLRRQVLVAERMRHDAALSAKRGKAGSLDPSLLAAGVAHEFNNILGAADGHAEWALESGKAEDQREALQVVRLACKRAHQITRALQGLSQPAEEKKSLFDLREVLAELERAFRPLCRKHQVELHIVASRALKVYGQPERLLEVLVNLLRNALESLQGVAGSLRLEADMQGKWVRLRVSNSGPAIPEPFRERIFEPFFTTKGVLAAAAPLADAGSATLLAGGGSGLGLFLSRSIAREHGGSLRLTKNAKPVTFELKLPAA